MSALVIVTVALGTTAPEASVTVPLSDPVEAVWAITDGAKVMNATARGRARALRIEIVFDMITLP